MFAKSRNPTGATMRPVAPAELERRVREVCLALPGATEKISHGAPAFFAGRQFVMLWSRGHHDADFAHMWCAAPPGAQQELTATEPDRFFRPPYVGGRGWIGVRLDGDLDWDEIASICEDAFRTVAPNKLVAQLDSTGRTTRSSPGGRPRRRSGGT